MLQSFQSQDFPRFLSSNKGRVFNFEALLNNTWGYYYYGGDRTVDVYIRQLRSKLKVSTNTFIETVRNIGCKFRKET
ncbi:winged helix-turn-helix domain-containing protein [Chloroflexota bacterium]